MSKALLVTVGVGKAGDVHQAILRSVKQTNPDRLILLVTKTSKEQTYETCLKPALAARPHSTEDLTDPDDLDKTYCECYRTIRSLLREGFPPDDISVDFTSGTKVMSAALCMAALELGVKSYIYVAGERGEYGRVSSGHMKLISSPVVSAASVRLLSLAVRFFNAYRFEAAGEIAKPFCEDYAPRIAQPARTLCQFAEALDLWDRFEYAKAFEALKRIPQSTSDPFALVKQKQRMISHVEECKRTIEFFEQQHRSKASRPTSVAPLVADMLANASRRASEARYDDAVARLYRLTEFLAQAKLELDHGVNTACPTESQKFAQLQDKLCWPNEGDKRLALEQSYKALDVLGDPFGQRFFQLKIAKAKNTRNSSFLAHGFATLDKDKYESMESAVTTLIEVYPGDITKAECGARFPELDISALDNLT